MMEALFVAEKLGLPGGDAAPCQGAAKAACSIRSDAPEGDAAPDGRDPVGAPGAILAYAAFENNRSRGATWCCGDRRQSKPATAQPALGTHIATGPFAASPDDAVEHFRAKNSNHAPSMARVPKGGTFAIPGSGNSILQQANRYVDASAGDVAGPRPSTFEGNVIAWRWRSFSEMPGAERMGTGEPRRARHRQQHCEPKEYSGAGPIKIEREGEPSSA
jgi:hypothetical protein